MAWLAFGPLQVGVPIRVLAENDVARAFPHPRPSYPTHILIVPKRRVRDYLGATAPLLDSVLDLTAELAAEQPVELVTNLGNYQDVKFLHFHLIPAADGGPNGEQHERGRVEEILAATTSAARSALAANGCSRVIITRTAPNSIGWRVV
jgi:histidine triad (HIT) family protein